MLQSRWPDNFFKLDMEAQTVPCLGLSTSKSVQQISQYGRGPACLPPGTRIQSFLAMFVFCDDVFEPPAQQARLEQHLYAFPLSRKVCSCMPEGISVAAVCQGGPRHSCRCPGLGWEMALEHIWSRRHCTRQLQDNYKTTTRQPTRQPTRQLQTWCKISILLVCGK